MSAAFTLDEVLAATGGRVIAPTAGKFGSVSTDTRAIAPGALFVALKGERFDAHDFLDKAADAGAAAAIVRRGTKLDPPGGFGLIEVEDTLLALQHLARLHRRRFGYPIGGIGGSNGKTTTKEMIGAVLAARGPSLKTEGNLNNEVGVPLTLLRLEPGLTGAVLEMGMNHLGELERISLCAEADAVGLTNIGPEHLEFLGDLDGVAKAEAEIFKGVKRGGTAVANADDALVMREAKASGLKLLTFGRDAKADVRLEKVLVHDLTGLKIRIGYGRKKYDAKLGFVGEHNAVNATCAFAMGIALGVSPEQCVAGLETAAPFKHRLVLHQLPNGVTVVDDCYNANPASMDAALATIAALAQGRRRLAVLGDMLEVGHAEAAEHRGLGERAAASGLAAMVAFGPRSKDTFDGAHKLGRDRLHVPDTASVEPALAFLKERLQPDDVVLVKGSRGMKLERVVDALVGTPESPGHARGERGSH